MKRLFFTTALILSIAFSPAAQVAETGKPLPPWQDGYLDLHHINTGRGSCAFYIFPDGTTMLFDAGEMPESPRVLSPRNSVIRPDNSKKPYEWIAHYIRQVEPLNKNNVHIDFAAISHFHDDHFGGWYHNAPVSSTGKYVLSGITGVGDLITILNMLDRGRTV